MLLLCGAVGLCEKNNDARDGSSLCCDNQLHNARAECSHEHLRPFRQETIKYRTRRFLITMQLISTHQSTLHIDRTLNYTTSLIDAV